MFVIISINSEKLMLECAKSSIHPNHLNLPVCDIHQKEARDQILYNFHNLANATSSISQRQWQKCQEQNERIKVLGERIMKCKTQLNHFQGLNKPLTFISPCEYPKKYEFNIDTNQSHLKDFLEHKNPNKYDHNACYLSKHDPNEIGKQSKLKIKDLHECATYIFDQLRMKQASIFEKSKRNDEEIDNFGKVPQNIKYLDSLSVFNSDINPYRKYSIQNNIFRLENRSKIGQQQLQKEKVSTMLSLPLSKYRKIDNPIEDNRYISQQNWQEVRFQKDLNLENLVDITGQSQSQNQLDLFEDKSKFIPTVAQKGNNNQNFNQQDITSIIPHQQGKKSVIHLQKNSSFISVPTVANISQDMKEKIALPLPETKIGIQPIQKIQNKLPPPPPFDPSIFNYPEMPKIHLPPPPPPPILSIPAPVLDLPPPSFKTTIIPTERNNGIPKDNIVGLLDEIQNYSKSKLKPTKTKESGGMKNHTSEENQKEKARQRDKQPADSPNIFTVLKARRMRRHQNLHPDEYNEDHHD